MQTKPGIYWLIVCDPPDEWEMPRAGRRQPAAPGGIARTELSGRQQVVSVHIEEEDQVVWTEMAVLLDPTKLLASMHLLYVEYSNMCKYLSVCIYGRK